MNGTFVIWDRSLPENMKWIFGNMGLVSSNKKPYRQCCYFGKGWGGSTNQLLFGGVRTIGVNDLEILVDPDKYDIMLISLGYVLEMC